MKKVKGAPQFYEWGSSTAIPSFLSQIPDGRPVAELWFGAHPLGKTLCEDGVSVEELIRRDPGKILGPDIASTFSHSLPYLMKYIAVDTPLSLQVHPVRSQAEVGYRQEEQEGIRLDSFERTYKDPNHKPELIYALTQCEALSGFRARRRIISLFEDIDTDVARWIHGVMQKSLPHSRLHEISGVKKVTQVLLDPQTRPTAREIGELIGCCRKRLHRGCSPSPRADSIACQMFDIYPDDPGVIISLLLNPVTLQPGEVLFNPAGTLHCYVKGFGVEVMAASDNVVRVGLTRKYVDVHEALECIDFHAAPPVRLAPEIVSPHINMFYAPVDDFELCLCHLLEDQRTQLPVHGARMVACLQGQAVAYTQEESVEMVRGDVVFVPACDGPLTLEHCGDEPTHIAHIDVP
ncbi:MAG: mannose-6-phosphate isomerase, class I [Actinomycetaceae bacterium]|nr:mannose-6-phosphate isomerase, class I [Actinomycetaceae bacterium]